MLSESLLIIPNTLMTCCSIVALVVLCIFRSASFYLSAGWVYYHISNAMQYSNTALETPTLVMYVPKTFFYGVPLFLMALRILYTNITYHKHHKRC